jgi:hypothetical protein
VSDRHPRTGRFMAGDCERDCLDHCAGPCGVLPIGDRIRQAHAEHVAAVDPREGADSTEKEVMG